uniref:Uncharacterized protein n=1 Tax=Nothobranchius furzeri TaxID=105023 RepID=A0A1A7ZQT2_NOTFU
MFYQRHLESQKENMIKVGQGPEYLLVTLWKNGGCFNWIWCLKKDADMAHFLVTSYRKKQAPETAIQGGYVNSTLTPSKRTAAKMSHRLSPTEPVSEGEDFLMAGVEALADDLDLDPFEERLGS